LCVCENCRDSSNSRNCSFCRAMRCISAAYRHAVSVCPSVCLSPSWVAWKHKHFFKNFQPSGSQAILVFPYQTGWRYSDGNRPNGSVEYRWGRQKTRFWTNIWLRCIQVYTVVNRTSRDERLQSSSRALTAASVVRCSHETTTKCLWWARRYTPETEVKSAPDTTALVITSFCAAVRHRRTGPGGYFCWKLTLPVLPDAIRPTVGGPDPNRLTNGRKQGGYDLGGFGRTPAETIGENRI